MRLTENKYKSRKFINGAWEGRFRSCVHFSLVESNPQAEIPFSSSALWSQRKNSRLLGLPSIPGEFSRWTSKLVSSLTHPVGTAHIALPDSLYLSPLRQFQIALVGVQSWETRFKILLLIDLNSENILTSENGMRDIPCTPAPNRWVFVLFVKMSFMSHDCLCLLQH